MLNAPLPFRPLELDFETLNLDNLARVHDTLPRPQRRDDNLNFTRTPPLTNLLSFCLPPTEHAWRQDHCTRDQHCQQLAHYSNLWGPAGERHE